MKLLLFTGLWVAMSAFADGRPSHAEMEARIQAACGADVASLCPTAEGHERFKCLKENGASLSEACAAFMAHAPKRAAHHAEPPPPREE